jgi:hypothetical protein
MRTTLGVWIHYFLCDVLWTIICSFCPFYFCHCIVCLLLLTVSDYPFGIFKLFCLKSLNLLFDLSLLHNLSAKQLSQEGFLKGRLILSFIKFFGRYQRLVEKYSLAYRLLLMVLTIISMFTSLFGSA